MKFIGHLDIMRYFQKVMRRADVDIRYSGGFSPHQIMSFAAPLGVGLLSNGEYLDIEVDSTGSSAEMVRRMNAAMSEGMEVVSFRRLDDSAKSAMSLVAAADYVLAFRPGKEPEDIEAFFRAMADFYAQPQIPVTKKTKSGEKEMDLKPLIYRLERVWAVPYGDGPEVPPAEAKTTISETAGTQTQEPESTDMRLQKPEAAVAQTQAQTDAAAETAESERTQTHGAMKQQKALRVVRSGAVTEPADAVWMQVCTGSTDNVKPELVMEALYDFMGRPLPPFTFQTEREEVYADAGREGSGEGRNLVPLEALGEDIEQTDHYQA